MIIIKLKGGLGNQLFQYAFGRFLSIKRNEGVKLDASSLSGPKDTFRTYALDAFNIDLNIATNIEIQKNKYPYAFISKFYILFSQKVLKRYNIGYDKYLLKSKNKYFEGYFQSYKYLDPIRDMLLKEITPKESMEDKCKEVLENIKKSNSVSIHIRRGDYVNDEKTKQAHNVCDLEYYKKAINIINDKIENPVFFVFSDDINWVRENLKINAETHYVSNGIIKDFEELILMSGCKNNIIANSSFSFWGAWLNKNGNKIVIAPKKWHNKLDSEYKDLLPENWIKI